ncbi:putative holin-like toxin [Guptibacillus spartinae]
MEELTLFITAGLFFVSLFNFIVILIEKTKQK